MTPSNAALGKSCCPHTHNDLATVRNHTHTTADACGSLNCLATHTNDALVMLMVALSDRAAYLWYMYAGHRGPAWAGQGTALCTSCSCSCRTVLGHGNSQLDAAPSHKPLS